MLSCRALLQSNRIFPCHRVSIGKIVENGPSLMVARLNHNRHFSADSSNGNLERVYYGSLTSRMRAVKVFSLTTSLSGIAAQPILMEQGAKIGGTPMIIFLCGFVGFFTFVTPILLHFVTKKYVTEIHYNPKSEEYIASTISFFVRKIETKFKPCDVRVPDVPGMFTSFMVNKTPLFVDPSLFSDPNHYIKIMGYDKPIDFKLELSEHPKGNVDKSKKE